MSEATPLELQTWFLVLRTWIDRTDADKWIGEHLEWMREEHNSGRIVMSGPSADREYGIYLVRAPSIADAAAIAERDPFVVQGLARQTIIQWEVHQILGIGDFSHTMQGTPTSS
jgi:uncharacterized protein